MLARVTLSVVEGPSVGVEYVFDERATGLVGRSTQCRIQITDNGKAAPQVSRHHCMLDVNPPNVRIQDFGSLNGTYVNGDVIGRREHGQTPEEGARNLSPERDLYDGDRIKLGPFVLEVGIDAGLAENSILDTQIQCSKCGAAIRGDAVRHDGNMVCVDCQKDLMACVSQLLNAADAGETDLGAIRGFEIMKELGRGGQGVVYMARDRSSRDVVALKVLLAKIAATPDASKQFLREVQSISSLEHPHIVGFRNAGQFGGQFFFTCEFCEGGSVADLIKRRQRPLSVDAALSITQDILAGLHYAHNAKIRVPGHGIVKGLVHRDIKPANILLTGSSGGMPSAKLADFGLSKAFDLAGLSGHTLTGGYAGTIWFMSRAQLVNYKYVTPAVDVWSVAASLYWMLVGVPPRDFSQPINAYRVVLETDPVPIREHDSIIPQALADVIDTALTESPRMIVEDAAHFAAMLRKAAAG